MIRSLITPELDARLQSLDGYIDRTKPLCNNPTIGPVVVCGAIRGLEIPVCALASLALRFVERTFFVLCQNLDRIDCAELLEVECSAERGQLSRELNSHFPGIFTGDLVVCWGHSQRWHILFDAQLSLGVLVVNSEDDKMAAVDAYSAEDELLDVSQAFSECASYEVQDLPEGIRETTATALSDSWGVLNGAKHPPTPDSARSTPRG